MSIISQYFYKDVKSIIDSYLYAEILPIQSLYICEDLLPIIDDYLHDNKNALKQQLHMCLHTYASGIDKYKYSNNMISWNLWRRKVLGRKNAGDIYRWCVGSKHPRKLKDYPHKK